MVTKLSDKELLEELQCRFEQHNRSVEMFTDLNAQLQRLNHTLLESEKTKSYFLSNIRNEINNPLASILGLSKYLQTLYAPLGKAELSVTEKARYMTELIYREAFHLDFQLRNLFAAAEIESGECFPEIIQTQVGELIKEVIKCYTPDAEAKRIALHLTNRLPQQSFRTDPAKLQLILSNLLANAIEYSPVGSKVYVRAWKQGQQLSVSVRDQGKGIATENRERLFNRFTQLDSGTAKMHKGQGLGLSVVRSLLEVLNGTIELSGRVNHGSLFTISISEPDCGFVDCTTDGHDFFFS